MKDQLHNIENEELKCGFPAQKKSTSISKQLWMSDLAYDAKEKAKILSMTKEKDNRLLKRWEANREAQAKRSIS